MEKKSFANNCESICIEKHEEYLIIYEHPFAD